MSANFIAMVGKALSDPAFAEKLKDQPEEALQDIGVEATDDILEALKGIDRDALERLARAMDPQPLFAP